MPAATLRDHFKQLTGRGREIGDTKTLRLTCRLNPTLDTVDRSSHRVAVKLPSDCEVSYHRLNRCYEEAPKRDHNDLFFF